MLNTLEVLMDLFKVLLLLMKIMLMELVLRMVCDIWTFSTTIYNCDSNKQDFVGSHYFCDQVIDCRHNRNRCPTTQLWSGNGNGGARYFHRKLTEFTGEDIEIRVCRDQAPTNEDIFLLLLKFMCHLNVFISLS